MTMAKRLKAMGSPKYQNDGDSRTSGPGFGVSMHPESVLEPILKWPRTSRIAFLDSMSDVFHARVSAEFLGRIFATMALTPQHTYQVLTKRPNRMRELLNSGRVPGAMHEALLDLRRHGPRLPDPTTRLLSTRAAQCPWPLPNVWLGTSIESDEYCWRADQLREVPAAVRFLSLEPLLGPLPSLDLTGIDWVIVGGESGPRARPMSPEWARSVRDRCRDNGIAFHFKQWGEWAPVAGHHYSDLESRSEPADTVRKLGKKAAGRSLDGRTWDEFPKPDGVRASA
jgi:protein gp37